jgi:hypothetical protein
VYTECETELKSEMEKCIAPSPSMGSFSDGSKRIKECVARESNCMKYAALLFTVTFAFVSIKMEFGVLVVFTSMLSVYTAQAYASQGAAPHFFGAGGGAGLAALCSVIRGATLLSMGWSLLKQSLMWWGRDLLGRR